MKYIKWRSRTILSNTLLVLIGVAITALLIEGIVRIFVDEFSTPRFAIDPGYGVRANEPNAVKRHYMPGLYDISVSTNSAGMRGTREYSATKPEGVERILMLGDSFIFGASVEDSEVVGAVLEDLINSNSGRERSYEVINLAVIATGTAEQLVTYRAIGRNYQPDTVILFYFENDIGNNVASKLFELDEDGGVMRTGNAYLPGVKLSDMLYSIPGTRWLAAHSDAWYFVLNRVSALIHRRQDSGFTSKNDIAKDNQANDLTKALILQLVTDVQADGARPIVVIIPERKTTLNSNFPLDTKTLNELNVEFLDGREYLINDDYFYPGDRHWNASGHRKTARKLAEILNE